VYGFRRWRSHTDRRVDQLLDSHGFRASHGNVHEFSFANHRWRLYEAQTRLHDFATWRVLLYDYSTRRLRPLTLTTAHGSFRTSFGEPIAEVARAPSESGRVLIVTMFVFGTGQATREKEANSFTTSRCARTPAHPPRGNTRGGRLTGRCGLCFPTHRQ